MSTPWMFVVGCTIVGWVAAEILGAVAKRSVPVGLNIVCAAAGGLLAGAYVP